MKWKIMLPFLVLTALFALFATRNVTELVTASLEERLASQLVSASRRANDDLAKQEREHLELVRGLSFTEGVTEAIAARDVAALEALLVPPVANSGATHVEVFDASGWRLLGLRDPRTGGPLEALAPGNAPQDWTVVGRVLDGERDERGDKWVQLASGELVTAGPVFADDGSISGVVAVATPLDEILLGVKRDSLADVTFFGADGALAGSTFDANDATEENGFFHGLSTVEASAVTRGDVLGREFQFLNAELSLRGAPAGSLSVGLPLESISSTGQSARVRMSVIFGLTAVGVVLIGWMVARHLTSRLKRLVDAATAVAAGDLSARSNVGTGDEIGILGVQFDSMAERLERQHLATIGALASAIDARDPYTAGHSVRVGDLSAELGTNLGLPKAALHHLRVGGLLHDIGKIGVRDTILLKPGGLSEDERKLIEQHPTIGLRILEGAQLPRQVLEIVGGHHERLNGKGYPLGLSADELSVFPRIAAVADMYDALTTDRPYREGLSPQEAIRILWKDSETGFLDPEVVASMRRIAQMWEERRKSDALHAEAWAESLKALRSEAA